MTKISLPTYGGLPAGRVGGGWIAIQSTNCLVLPFQHLPFQQSLSNSVTFTSIPPSPILKRCDYFGP